jgi:hypothetical protein
MKKIYTLSITLLFVHFLQAQTVASYNFSQSNGVYTSISAGTLYGTNVDDVIYGGTPNLLPFTFNFNGVGYTTFYISSNGFITLGNATTPSATNYTPLSNASAASNNVISPYGVNLIPSTIRYEILGSSPNRIAVIQWTGSRAVGFPFLKEWLFNCVLTKPQILYVLFT